jgi:hypothetical protein
MAGAGMFRPSLSVPVDGPAMRAAALALLALCCRDLRRTRQPPLYSSGVRYRREGPGREVWQLPSQTMSEGTGDCEDLAGWRCAELRLAGVKAEPVFLPIGRPGNWHCVVKWPDGTIEDPSAALGMPTSWRGRIRG